MNRVRPEEQDSSPSLGPAPRRSVPHLVLGLLLVVTCALGVTVGVMSMTDRTPVLVLARPVTAGQVIDEPDLRVVGVWVDPSVDVVPAADAPQVVGRSVAVPLSAGAVLPWGALGQSRVPPAGHAVTAVAVSAGQFPPRISAGAHVSVIAAAAESGVRPVRSGAWAAIVVAVDPNGADPTSAVLSLQLAERDAEAVAVLPAGAIRIVLRDGA